MPDSQSRWKQEQERRRQERERRRQERKQERKQLRSQQDRHFFGEELWGASKAHREAETDLDKLARYDLPILESEKKLAQWLGIPLSGLRWFTHDKPADTVWHYVAYTIPKRNGGERLILAPKVKLKILQYRVFRISKIWRVHLPRSEERR